MFFLRRETGIARFLNLHKFYGYMKESEILWLLF